MRGTIPIKFTDTQFDNYGIQKAHPVIRFAEVLLPYAEAENELNGPTQNAVDAVKQTTDRAGIEIPASALANKDAFRNFLLEERGHELYCEGQRRQDLIRHGVYISRARERGTNAQDYRVLFPIPQTAITEAGGILEQNPGYTN
ncbi:MAG: RagB/SusD family nutrient uptake outer membrane protein [Bacteroides intestinalis]|nr:RagB/SusD family nutrient uptake outer membrane protein [Bacteroides intestinalis]